MSKKLHTSNKVQIVIVSALVSLLVMMVWFGVILLASTNPKEETIVPKVVGMNLSEAMLLLQNSDLSAEITTNFVEDPQFEAGLVLQQSPIAGTYTKIGNAIRLNVSAGLAISELENFVGLRIEDVRTAIVTRYNGLLSINQPLIYLNSNDPEGMIIGQDPEAGATISGPLAVSFLVSRGLTQNSQILTSYEGLAFERALLLAAQNNIPFQFIIEGEAVEGYPVVARQEPIAGSELKVGDSLYLYINPILNSTMVLGTHEITIPEYSAPIKIEAAAIIDGREVTFFSTYQQGVRLIMPYYQPAGTRVIIRANGVEQGSFTV